MYEPDETHTAIANLVVPILSAGVGTLPDTLVAFHQRRFAIPRSGGDLKLFNLVLSRGPKRICVKMDTAKALNTSPKSLIGDREVVAKAEAIAVVDAVVVCSRKTRESLRRGRLGAESIRSPRSTSAPWTDSRARKREIKQQKALVFDLVHRIVTLVASKVPEIGIALHQRRTGAHAVCEFGVVLSSGRKCVCIVMKDVKSLKVAEANACRGCAVMRDEEPQYDQVAVAMTDFERWATFENVEARIYGDEEIVSTVRYSIRSV